MLSEEELFSKINIALTRTNNSTSTRNETYIDKEVLQGLLNYIEKLQKENNQYKDTIDKLEDQIVLLSQILES